MPLAGGTAPVLGVRTGRRKKEEASNKPTTGLQHAYNIPSTPARLRNGYGVAPVPPGDQDAFGPSERPR
jgi:hypothetical protein